MINVKNLSYRVKKREILKNISFSTPQNGLFFILGSNGSGKTTLLKNIAKILKPTSGEVLLDGENLNEYDKDVLLSTISYMPQTAQAPRLSVFDALLLSSKNSGFLQKKELLESVSKILERLNLAPFASRYCNELSGGELQRVLIAISLINSPKILLLDEPTNHLDIKHRYYILELLKELSSSMLIVVVSHEINAALKYGSAFMLLKKGEIVSDKLDKSGIEECFEIDTDMLQIL